jgi:hypothetical protein
MAEIELAETPSVTVLCNYQKDVKSLLQSREITLGGKWNNFLCISCAFVFIASIKFYPPMPWRHIGGSGGIALFILNLGTRWKWVANFTLQLLYLQERTPVPIEQEAGWATEVVWTFWRREKSLAHTGIWTPDSPPACSLVIIPTMLPRL